VHQEVDLETTLYIFVLAHEIKLSVIIRFRVQTQGEEKRREFPFSEHKIKSQYKLITHNTTIFLRHI
jgi:hypothetical protein